ncbi:MAG TPA: hypothetical protein DEB20_01845, partial [Acidimicrobiaceae bacterium]|nr:hypothetical protein [Acidimicrobiaceae bacterium]
HDLRGQGQGPHDRSPRSQHSQEGRLNKPLLRANETKASASAGAFVVFTARTFAEGAVRNNRIVGERNFDAKQKLPTLSGRQ